MKTLSGYKTYFIAIAIGAVTAIHSLGVIDENTANLLIMLLTGGGLATLRSGIKTDTQKAVSAVTVVGQEVGVRPGAVQAAARKIDRPDD